MDYLNILMQININTKDFWHLKTLLIILGAIIICFITYSIVLTISKKKNDNKYMKYGLKICFIIYILLVFFMTVFNRGLILNISFSNLIHNISSSNFIPFRETYLLIKDVINYGVISNTSLLIGNIVLLIPLALFLPRILKKSKDFKHFCLYTFLITFTIEILQLLSHHGIFDIDDLIWNSLGAIVFYYSFNKTFISRIFNKIFLLKDEEISKKDIVKFIVIILVIASFIIGSIYFYYFYDSAISIDYLIENKNCLGAKELLGEDENYYYYITDACSDSYYIIFNNKDKYLLKDFIAGKVGKYTYKKRYYLNNLIGNEYIVTKSKYYEFELTYNQKVFIEEEIESNIIKLKTISISGDVLGNTTYKYSVIPNKSGETSITFKIYDRMNNEQVEIIIKKFKIDKNLNVTEIN